MVGSRVKVEARMLSLDSSEVSFVDSVLEELAHELKLLGEPCRVLEDEFRWAHFYTEYVNVLAELIDGVDRVPDLEEELTELEVYHAGYRFNLQYIRVVEPYIE